ncbi:hypothetical protein NRB_26360 [Novosphingobium sp. 11B]
MKLLLAVLGGLGRVAAWLLGLARRHPAPTACAALLVLAWWQWSGKEDALAGRDQARTALATEKKSREAERAGWRREVAAAQATTAAAERKSQEIASDAQTSHDALAADNAGLRNYIAARGLRSGSGVPTATFPADDLGAAVHAAAPASAVVAADTADLVSCDGAYVYAASAYEWAQGLITAGLAKPESAGR